MNSQDIIRETYDSDLKAQKTSLISASTIYAVVNTSAVAGTQNSLTTLNAGPNQIGSVTISNTVPVTFTGNVLEPAITITPYNKTLTSADTEYSQALTANTRGVRFRCRTLYDVRYAWVTGKVATPTAPYLTLPAGMDYFADGLDLTSKTLYLASAQAGVVVEIEEYT